MSSNIILIFIARECTILLNYGTKYEDFSENIGSKNYGPGVQKM